MDAQAESSAALSEDIEFYRGNRSIKIQRFFEVANYLTENHLWDEVEKAMERNEYTGGRLVLDQHLGNAVKLVLANHHRQSNKPLPDIVKSTILCAHAPCKNCGD